MLKQDARDFFSPYKIPAFALNDPLLNCTKYRPVFQAVAHKDFKKRGWCILCRLTKTLQHISYQLVTKIHVFNAFSRFSSISCCLKVFLFQASTHAKHFHGRRQLGRCWSHFLNPSQMTSLHTYLKSVKVPAQPLSRFALEWGDKTRSHYLSRGIAYWLQEAWPLTVG